MTTLKRNRLFAQILPLAVGVALAIGSMFFLPAGYR